MLAGDANAVIASLWPMGEDFNTTDAPERAANGRAIAAVPALLDALAACVTPLEHLGNYVGNVATPSMGGPGYDRCAILLAVRDALRAAGRAEA